MFVVKFETVDESRWRNVYDIDTAELRSSAVSILNDFLIETKKINDFIDWEKCTDFEYESSINGMRISAYIEPCDGFEKELDAIKWMIE